MLKLGNAERAENSIRIEALLGYDEKTKEEKRKEITIPVGNKIFVERIIKLTNKLDKLQKQKNLKDYSALAGFFDIIYDLGEIILNSNLEHIEIKRDVLEEYYTMDEMLQLIQEYHGLVRGVEKN